MEHRYRYVKLTSAQRPKVIAKLLINQGYRCAICDWPIYPNKFHSIENSVRMACLDHNPKTGHPREMLCQNCNVGLGNFMDSVDLLTKAIAYIKTHR